jgi:Asp-tRNA(Asn)/Glu-tRNA(Gln) amidotransferase A subunit family amidase
MLSAVDYIQANRARRLLIERMAGVMGEVDVFVTPSFGANVLALTNGAGHPTVVIPNGFNDAGAPVSLSFVGGLYKEAAALTVAHAYQQATGWHRKHPALDFAE